MKHSIAGIICIDSLYFIAKRLPTGDMGNRWEFPGGKVEDGESYEQAIKREFMEEFALNVTIGEHLADASFTHHGVERQLHAYEVFFPVDNINWVLSEHSEVQWVPLDEIETLDFVDSDLLLLPKLKEIRKKQIEKMLKE